MQINRISNINNQTFGMAVTTDKKTLDFISKNLSKKDVKKFAKLAESQKHNPIDIELSLVNRTHDIVFADKLIDKITNENVICANVSEELFYTDELRTFRNPIIKLMQKATKYADKLNSVIFNIENNVKIR